MTSAATSIQPEGQGAVIAASPAVAATPATEQKAPATGTPQQQQEPTKAADKVLEALKPADAPKKEAEKPAAPEKYEAWKLPEGVKLSDGINDTFSEIARKAGLSQADAQASLDKLISAQREQVQADLRGQVEQWGEALANDPEIGGAKLDKETMPNVAKALAAYDTDGSLRELLLSGLGTHPAIVRVLAKVGKAVSQPTELVTGSQRRGPSADPEVRAKRFFGQK